MDQNTTRLGSLDLSVIARYVQPDDNTQSTAPEPSQMPLPAFTVPPALPTIPAVPRPPSRELDPRKIKKFQCPNCGSMHQSPANLRTHQREKHTREKPFHCVLCPSRGKFSAFARKWVAERHVCYTHDIDKEDAAQYVRSEITLRPRRRRSQQGLSPQPPNQQYLPSQNHSSPNVSASTDTQQQQQQQQQPPPMDIECNYCPKLFQLEDTALMHEHMSHDIDPMPDCDCSVCEISHAGDFGNDPAWLDTSFYTAEWRFRPQLYESESVSAQHAAYAAEFPVWDESGSL